MADEYQSPIPKGAISEDMFVNTFNADLNTSVAHGVGFYALPVLKSSQMPR